ncbi:zinc finger MYM-type protein 5-like [Belonocnema kinseyi]|uniref:zinc finger MYM-type protein 5-like n=1 Tax=Belonocnema kinseyi TaxID=2817044 RepID=UPI00143D28C0|nr:zinc finger MYM-type protein 5-like [Belonocnema kinseyi]
MSKRPSGAEYRKLKKRREEEDRQNANRTKLMDKYICISTAATLAPIEAPLILQVNKAETPVIALTEELSIQNSSKELQISTILSSEEAIPSSSLEPLPTSTPSEVLPISEKNIEEPKVPIDTLSINYNDPTSWPPMSDKIKQILVAHGSDQGNDINFKELPKNASGRRLKKDWFLDKQQNGEKIERKWLIYFKNKNAIFCFPCLVFDDSNHSKHLANSAEGFNDWKHLSPTLPDHENSIAHRDNYVKWKLLEKNIRNNVLIDDYVISQFEEEKKKWREILKVIIDVILFCASNNLTLRGPVEQIGNPEAEMKR